MPDKETLNDNNVFTKKYYIGTSQCDLCGNLKLNSLIVIMQNVANEHCDLQGIGNTDLRKKGLGWVLFKNTIKIDRYPVMGEIINISTFTTQSIFKYYPRYYIVTDKDGHIICSAGSLWMIKEKKSGKALSSKESGVIPYNYTSVEKPINISMTASKVDGEPIIGNYLPCYSDVDINGHVNNIRYIELLCNNLGFRMLSEKEISYLDVSYYKEISSTSSVITGLVTTNTEFQFNGHTDSQNCFFIYGRFVDRNNSFKGQIVCD